MYKGHTHFRLKCDFSGAGTHSFFYPIDIKMPRPKSRRRSRRHSRPRSQRRPSKRISRPRSQRRPSRRHSRPQKRTGRYRSVKAAVEAVEEAAEAAAVEAVEEAAEAAAVEAVEAAAPRTPRVSERAPGAEAPEAPGAPTQVQIGTPATAERRGTPRTAKRIGGSTWMQNDRTPLRQFISYLTPKDVVRNLGFDSPEVSNLEFDSPDVPSNFILPDDSVDLSKFINSLAKGVEDVKGVTLVTNFQFDCVTYEEKTVEGINHKIYNVLLKDLSAAQGTRLNQLTVASFTAIQDTSGGTWTVDIDDVLYYYSYYTNPAHIKGTDLDEMIDIMMVTSLEPGIDAPSAMDVIFCFIHQFMEAQQQITISEYRLIDAAHLVDGEKEYYLTPFLYAKSNGTKARGRHFYQRYGFTLTKESEEDIHEFLQKNFFPESNKLPDEVQMNAFEPDGKMISKVFEKTNNAELGLECTARALQYPSSLDKWTWTFTHDLANQKWTCVFNT